MKIMLIVGTRPQFIKSAILIEDLQKTLRFFFQLVHAGQHFDFEMSEIFFKSLQLREPNVNLSAGSGSQAQQTAIMMKLEKERKKCDQISF